MNDEADAKNAEVVRGDIVKPDEAMPNQVIALPLNQRPVFPHMMLPLMVPEGRLAQGMRTAIDKAGGWVAFFLTREPLEDGGEFGFEDLHEIGALARISKHQEGENGSIQVFAQVQARFRATEVISEDPVLFVRGRPERPEIDPQDSQVRALAMAIVTALKELVPHNPVFADEIKMVLANYNNLDGPGRLADLAATLTTADRDDIQEVLATLPIIPRMEKVLSLLSRERELAQLKSKITSQIEEKVSEHQRKFFLNEQLKAIKEELGIETDEKSLEIQRFQEAFDQRRDGMSEEVRSTVEEELRKLSLLEPASSEYGVARNRLEWLTELPWGTYSEDNLDLKTLRGGLDADHYGMDDVKRRIVEFCAVRKLRDDHGGGIICLVGPPGTGKTSIGVSIAGNLERSFYRFSVGGMRDEAEIKGHRRTYVGALPGKIAQALRRCETMNPVILLDEIDKLGASYQGDPASALLEVLDPEQNTTFLDHYLDVRLDLSRVLFICTANDLGGIPEPLRDRMELIRLPGYIEAEKVAIANKYLVPKQRKRHGLTTKDLAINKSALQKLVRGYAREAGVRRLEQKVATVMRQVAAVKAESPDGFQQRRISGSDLEDYLGKPEMSDDELMGSPVPGVVTGLAWTSMGGATLEIESIAIPAGTDKAGFQLSGQLGDVMKESAGLARSWLRAHGEELGVDPGWFDEHLIHLHVPAGATPKDGPSAGITMATAMLSLALGKAVKKGIGMTGELTLTGRVYPIGGVREKIVAARRAHLKQVILPQANERDWDELPDFLRTGLKAHFVSDVHEVLGLTGLVKKARR